MDPREREETIEDLSQLPDFDPEEFTNMFEQMLKIAISQKIPSDAKCPKAFVKCPEMYFGLFQMHLGLIIESSKENFPSKDILSNFESCSEMLKYEGSKEEYVGLLKERVIVYLMGGYIYRYFPDKHLSEQDVKDFNQMYRKLENTGSYFEGAMQFCISTASKGLQPLVQQGFKNPVPPSSENTGLLSLFGLFNPKEETVFGSLEKRFYDVFTKYSDQPHIAFVCLMLLIECQNERLSNMKEILLNRFKEDIFEYGFAGNGILDLDEEYPFIQKLQSFLEDLINIMVPDLSKQVVLQKIGEKILFRILSEEKFEISKDEIQSLNEIFSVPQQSLNPSLSKN